MMNVPDDAKFCDPVFRMLVRLPAAGYQSVALLLYALPVQRNVGSVDGKQLNGYFISGAQPFGKFKKLIDLAFKEAKK